MGRFLGDRVVGSVPDGCERKAVFSYRGDSFDLGYFAGDAWVQSGVAGVAYVGSIFVDAVPVRRVECEQEVIVTVTGLVRQYEVGGRIIESWVVWRGRSRIRCWACLSRVELPWF